MSRLLCHLSYTAESGSDGALNPWSPLTESNRRPSPYHGDALPTELRGRRSAGQTTRMAVVCLQGGNELTAPCRPMDQGLLATAPAGPVVVVALASEPGADYARTTENAQ